MAAENDYRFNDDTITIFSKSTDYNGEASMEYTSFVKVYETSKYLFLFQPDNQVFIVEKSTVTGGSAEEIRKKFSSFLKKAYVICKY